MWITINLDSLNDLRHLLFSNVNLMNKECIIYQSKLNFAKLSVLTCFNKLISMILEWFPRETKGGN